MMWRKAANSFMVLVARPNHRSIEVRHTHHERRYSPSLRSFICCTQKMERRVRRWTTVVACRRYYYAAPRRKSELTRVAVCIRDGRKPERIEHPFEEMFKLRMSAISSC